MRRFVAHVSSFLLVVAFLATRSGELLAAPAITVSPDPASIGARVGFRGTGFPVDTLLTLSVATAAAPSQPLIAIPVPTDDAGNFGAGLTVPANGQFAPGGYTVTVADEGSKKTLATVGFTLTGDAGAASAAPAATGAGGTSPATPGSTDTTQLLLYAAIAVVALVIVALLLSAASAARRARAPKSGQ